MRLASLPLALVLLTSGVGLRSALTAATPGTAHSVSRALNPPATPLQNAVALLEGALPDPKKFAQTMEGFSEYLKASGVRDFTAADFTRPNHPEIAKRLGYTNFVPPQEWWDRGAALALLTQKIERVVGAHVTIRNWWRPADYNRQPGVDGASGSDHISASAVDLDYATPMQRARAEAFLRQLNVRAPWLHISLGLGPLTTHVGLLSPRGHREWHYAGYRPFALATLVTP